MTGVAVQEGRSSFQVVVGVDTHQDKHVAVAIDLRGVRLGEFHTSSTTRGYEDLEPWSLGLGEIQAFGIEGTGSYGAGVARFLVGRGYHVRGYHVVEVNRPDRATGYRKGKSDPTDAESAARSVLAGVADATPKSGVGEVEMIRMLKSAKDSAVKARTQAFNQMKALTAHLPSPAAGVPQREYDCCPGLCPQKLPARPPGQPHRSGQACPSFPGPPLPSTQQRDQGPGG